MADEPIPEAAGATLNFDAVLDEHGNLKVAFLLINLHALQISFHWLPEFFRIPMPEVLRKEIAMRLRMHADKLESGELEQEMQHYVSINEMGTHE